MNSDSEWSDEDEYEDIFGENSDRENKAIKGRPSMKTQFNDDNVKKFKLVLVELQKKFPHIDEKPISVQPITAISKNENYCLTKPKILPRKSPNLNINEKSTSSTGTHSTCLQDQNGINLSPITKIRPPISPRPLLINVAPKKWGNSKSGKTDPVLGIQNQQAISISPKRMSIPPPLPPCTPTPTTTPTTPSTLSTPKIPNNHSIPNGSSETQGLTPSTFPLVIHSTKPNTPPPIQRRPSFPFVSSIPQSSNNSSSLLKPMKILLRSPLLSKALPSISQRNKNLTTTLQDPSPNMPQNIEDTQRASEVMEEEYIFDISSTSVSSTISQLPSPLLQPHSTSIVRPPNASKRNSIVTMSVPPPLPPCAHSAPNSPKTAVKIPLNEKPRPGSLQSPTLRTPKTVITPAESNTFIINTDNILSTQAEITEIEREKLSRTVYCILEELLTTEQDYTKNLQHGITNYVTILDDNNLPLFMREHKNDIFSAIENIYEFHRNEFLPALLASDYDLQRIIQIFENAINEKKFHIYVLFAINKNRSNQLCDKFKIFFQNRATEVVDRLGVSSFLMHPIQRLPKYKLLIEQIIEELMRGEVIRSHNETSLARSCIVLRSLKEVIETTNGAVSFGDIIYGEDECEIDVATLGYFLKHEYFDILKKSKLRNSMLRRTYRGKVFLFERAIVFTECDSNDTLKLYYRGIYREETMGLWRNEGSTREFSLFCENIRQMETTFINSNPAKVEEWYKAIARILLEQGDRLRRNLVDNGGEIIERISQVSR